MMHHFWQRNEELVWKVPEQWFLPLSAALDPGLLSSSPGDHLRTLTLRLPCALHYVRVSGVGPRHQGLLKLLEDSSV